MALVLYLVCSPVRGQIGELGIERADVVIYGATPAGVSAAVAAARAGRSVVLMESGRWVGGMMSGGLSNTDVGQRGAEVITGLAAEFFDRTRRMEQARGACIGECESSFFFEPQVAERAFENMIRESGVVLERSLRLIEVVADGPRIMSLITSRGRLSARVFVDASCEGDLMALSGVPYRVGREPRMLATGNDPAALGEQEDSAGVQEFSLPLGPYLYPYRVPGNPASGTIAWVEPRPEPLPMVGSGDSRVTAYTYRLCVTDDPANRIPFSRPTDYDANDYALHARFAAAATPDLPIERALFNPSPVTLSRDEQYYKYDLNSSLTLSTDLTAEELNQTYVESAPVTRLAIARTYRDCIQGLLYALRTDPRFRVVNELVDRFGYCADEFTELDGWPHQFYARVGRRMIGRYDMNENDVMQNGRRAPIADPVALGSYALAAHSHRYFSAPVEWPDGERRDAVVLEGLVIGRLPDDKPYPIAYRSLTPRAADAVNLLNPVTLSATSVAYSSIRMEPTFMMLGEAAGTAAALAVAMDSDVQAVSYERLRAELLDNGLRLSMMEP